MRSNELGLLASIAVRFLRGRRSRLLNGTARAALLGTAIGTAAMVIAMALMTGYREDLLGKITRGSAAVLVYPMSAADVSGDGAELKRRLAGLEHVDEVRRVSYGQGSLAPTAPTGPAAPATRVEAARAVDVSLRGVDSLDSVAGLGAVEPLEGSSGVRPEVPGVVLGAELAEELDAGGGELFRLMVLGVAAGKPRFGYETVTAVGTFRSGFSEFDSRLVVLERSRLESLAGAGVGESVFEVAVSKLARTTEVAQAADALLGPNFLVVDWRELNSELFTALAIQKLALFLILGLIVLVSTFNVASNLVVLVRERMRDVGVLAALGLGPRALRSLFLLYGGGLGAAGLVLGVATGWGLSWALTRFELVRFESELAAIYFVSSVPFRVRLLDVAAIVFFTLGVTAVACWFPAGTGSRTRPAEALRYE